MATIADLPTKTLADAGVERIWGVTGDSLNGLSDSLHRVDRIVWMHVRHEETAAFAAGAEAALTGKLAVCAGSCGPVGTPSSQTAVSGAVPQVPTSAVVGGAGEVIAGGSPAVAAANPPARPRSAAARGATVR